jgi:HAE1 family hydrophobic/amphiphilic exporter-1
LEKSKPEIQMHIKKEEASKLGLTPYDISHQVETYATLAIALLISLVLVFAVMASLYENLSFPFINMFTIPLGFIGVVVMLAITGHTINMGSIMGLIILGGIAVNNGIIMVDYINQLVAEGMDKLEAVVQGAVTRLRPILITSLTTVVGMIPMALATKDGGEMNSPMAVALIGGLTVMTFLTLVFIPVLYTYFAKIKISGK